MKIDINIRFFLDGEKWSFATLKPQQTGSVCQTSFARTLALGLLSPSLLPNVIPAQAGISLRHPLPPCLGRTALRGFAP